MRTIGNLRREVRKAYRKSRNWRKVGKQFGVNVGTAWRLANEKGYEPKATEIRRKLGLQVMGLAPVCPDCGRVHVKKRCKGKMGNGGGGGGHHYRSLSEIPVDLLRWMLEHREEVDDGEV